MDAAGTSGPHGHSRMAELESSRRTPFTVIRARIVVIGMLIVVIGTLIVDIGSGTRGHSCRDGSEKQPAYSEGRAVRKQLKKHLKWLRKRIEAAPPSRPHVCAGSDSAYTFLTHLHAGGCRLVAVHVVVCGEASPPALDRARWNV